MTIKASTTSAVEIVVKTRAMSTYIGIAITMSQRLHSSKVPLQLWAFKSSTVPKRPSAAPTKRLACEIGFVVSIPNR